MLKVVVLTANVTGREGGKMLLDLLGGSFPTLRHLFVDGGNKAKWVAWVKEHRS